jgi:protein-S-isoprenylcysteine O-methyltransferase
LAAPLLRLAPVPSLPTRVAATGVVLQLMGIGIRAWSMLTLGRAYTRTLRTEGGQHVIDHGPYRLVRHPGYLGSLLIWLGFGLTAQSLPAATVVVAVVGDAYRRRIAAEEVLLARDLPGYAAYVGRTKRLLPLIW